MPANECSTDDGNLPHCNFSVVINAGKEYLNQWFSNVKMH